MGDGVLEHGALHIVPHLLAVPHPQQLSQSRAQDLQAGSFTHVTLIM